MSSYLLLCLALSAFFNCILGSESGMAETPKPGSNYPSGPAQPGFPGQPSGHGKPSDPNPPRGPSRSSRQTGPTSPNLGPHGQPSLSGHSSDPNLQAQRLPNDGSGFPSDIIAHLGNPPPVTPGPGVPPYTGPPNLGPHGQPSPGGF